MIDTQALIGIGVRRVHKHLWRLPIPEFDASDADHVAVSEAGRDAAAGVERELVL